MRAHEVARLFGVSERQILVWGAKGLIRRSRTAVNQPWEYDAEHVLELRQIDPKTYEYVDPPQEPRTRRYFGRRDRRTFDIEDTEEL